tara:strand:+ start:67 stop:1011 length:945 start_codon:yes stop_codon:yes gene_type:complete
MLMLVNGCSHTEGAEIIKPGPEGCPITSKKRAWGAHLSKKLGFDYLNIALSGASNYKIKTNTQDWIIENVLMKKKIKIKDLFVCIMWSSMDRFELYNEKENISESASTFWLTIMNDKSHPENALWWKDYSAEYKLNLKKYLEGLLMLEDHLTYQYNFLSIVYDMMLFLERYNIKYFFINGIHTFIPPLALDMEHPNYTSIMNLYFNMENKIDRHYAFYDKDCYNELLKSHDKNKKEKDKDIKKFINKFGRGYKNNLDILYSNVEHQYSYLTYFQDILKLPHPKWSQTHHWGEDAHIIWADKLYKFIEQKRDLIL